MKYYQCKCGTEKFWGSGMCPPACGKCRPCGSDMASGPESHREPVDHEFYASKVETDDGEATLSRCRYCHLTKKQIDEEEQRWKAKQALKAKEA